MLKQLQMGLRAFLLVASKIWSFICYVIRKQVRAVSVVHASFRKKLVIQTVDSALAIGCRAAGSRLSTPRRASEARLSPAVFVSNAMPFPVLATPLWDMEPSRDYSLQLASTGHNAFFRHAASFYACPAVSQRVKPKGKKQIKNPVFSFLA